MTTKLIGYIVEIKHYRQIIIYTFFLHIDWRLNNDKEQIITYYLFCRSGRGIKMYSGLFWNVLSPKKSQQTLSKSDFGLLISLNETLPYLYIQMENRFISFSGIFSSHGQALHKDAKCSKLERTWLPTFWQMINKRKKERNQLVQAW